MSNNVSILLGNGAGSFGSATNFGVGNDPISVAVGDFNGDGKQDLAVANANSANVSILLDNCPVTLGNYPDTTLPLSTDTTVTPDAMPANVTSITVSSATDFKGTLEGDPATGVVRVTDAHPAGTYTVMVTGFSSMGVRTNTEFALTVTTPVTCIPVSFAAATNFGAGSVPASVAVGDFNGDGKQDLAVANTDSDNVSILLGNGAGSFGSATNFGAGSDPYSVAVGDFNGDGKQDLAVANLSSNNVSILLGNGAGSFGSATNFGAGSSPFSVAVGDFNGDGKQDLAVANINSNNVSILLGNGTGSFGSATNFGADTTPVSVAVGDFNGDGKQDLAVANLNSNNVSILLGNGAGSFGSATNFGADTTPISVAVGDFNGDGKQDLAVANLNSNNVSILLGNGAGSFGSATNFGAGTGPYSVAVGDFNGDGKQDLAVANINSNNVSILLGNGAGSFGSATNFGAGSDPESVAVGDFNGDGKQDLAVANEGSDNVSILLRACANHAPAGMDKAVTTLEDTAFTFVVADFGFTDPDDSPPNNLLAVKITTLPAAGSLTLESNPVMAGEFVTAADINLGKLQFTPALNGNGMGYTSFTFQVQDDGGTANGGADLDPTPNTMTIDVTPVNDPPTATNLSAGESYTEDTPLNLIDIVVSDVDSATVTVTLTLSNVSAGSLSTATSGAVTSTYNAGTGVWTAAGPIADVNTLLAGVTFVPAA